ncbi:MAG: flagellar hook protein FlgE [Burkholderiales bacterium]|nr:flagellar hook protein FlgE [Burkholderiales bacterium]
MSFQQGLSGLNAASRGLDVAGNNIANASTVGFKVARPEFADVFANSLAGTSTNAVGIGTQIAAVKAQVTQGNISVTSNPFDLAINGGGYFRMSENGTVSYTRNGQFGSDRDGYIVDSGARRLTGYPADAAGAIVPSSPVEIRLSTTDIAPQTTTRASLGVNLDSRSAAPPPLPPFDTADVATFNSSTAMTVYDTLGNPHVMGLYFRKTAANAWDMYTNLDGGAPGAPTALAFSATGALTTAMPLAQSHAVATGAASPLAFSLDLTGTSQYGSSFGVNSIFQDGYTSGRLTGVFVGSDGIVQGRYSNGQTRNLAQVVLANFINVQGLKPISDNQYAETPDSGAPLVGAPGTGSLGTLQASAVEESNVDLTAELVNLITLQRVYQANAQTIKTQDAVLQTLVNIR